MSEHDPAIIEAAARALRDYNNDDENPILTDDDYIRAVLAAVTPLIEAVVLEKAAKVAEDYDGEFEEVILAQGDIAAAIRALITKDSGGGD